MAGYCKLGDVDGESTDASHPGWINLLSVSQQLMRLMPEGASGSTRQRVSVTCGSVLISKEVDAATPKILQALCDGFVFPEVKIDLCTSSGANGRVPYFKWVLTNVFVANYFITAETTAGEPPNESLALNYEEICWVYDKMGKDGSTQGKLESTWKVEQGVR